VLPRFTRTLTVADMLAIHPLVAQRRRQRAGALPQITRSALLRTLRMESAHPDKAVQRPPALGRVP